ncbi:MAG: amino acid ABC transporter substrate-binding protein [Gammaproteobacteria bacterium]|nr:amino acid ABC transporter substrate-binding protein [Gammaproteobacteria bacterium]
MKFRRCMYYLVTAALLLVALPNHAAEPPIRIGTTQSLSGQFKAFGTAQMEGLKMWVDDINARGMLLGRAVELVHYDDHSDAARSAWLYRKLINEDKVDLLIGPYSSELTLRASDIAEEYNFPMVSTAASADVIWERGYKNIFGIDTPSSNYMDPAVKAAAERGAKTVALFYADAEFSIDVAQGIRREAKNQGLRIVMDEKYPLAQSDFSELAIKLKNTDADIALGATYLEDSVAIGRALGPGERLDVDMVALTVGPALREFSDLLYNNIEGVVGVVQWLRTVRLPKAQDFSYRYRQKYSRNPGVHSAIGYSAGQVIEAAVRLARTTDKDALREQLGKLRFRSLLGHYRVDETGRQVGKSNYLLQWQDNRRRLVWPENIAERELIYPRP